MYGFELCAFFYDNHHKPTHAYNFEDQLNMNVDKIRAATRHYDDTLVLVTEYYWRSAAAHDSLGGEPSLADFQTLKKTLVEMKSKYLHLLSDRDHLLVLAEIYHDAQVGKEKEVDMLTYELDISQESL